jgi:hypothetical protein
VFGYVLVALALASMLTLDDELNETLLHRIVFHMEVSLAVYFTAEFLLRLWAVGADARYQGCYGRPATYRLSINENWRLQAGSDFCGDSYVWWI